MQEYLFLKFVNPISYSVIQSSYSGIINKQFVFKILLVNLKKTGVIEITED